MSPQRRELRRQKREQADHDRATEQKRRLQRLGGMIGDQATLDRALRGLSFTERKAMTVALQPYLSDASREEEARFFHLSPDVFVSF